MENADDNEVINFGAFFNPGTSVSERRREEVSSPLPDFDTRSFVMDMEWRQSVGVSERPVPRTPPQTPPTHRRPHRPPRRHAPCSRRSCMRCRRRCTAPRETPPQETLSPEYVQNLLDIATRITRVWSAIEELTRV